jgi:hypothetical protein
VPFQNNTNLTNTNNLPNWEKQLKYLKNPYFFQHNSQDVYCFDFNDNTWSKVCSNNKWFCPKYSRATELPDGSFFLTGGEVNSLAVKSSCHYLNCIFSNKEDMIIARKAHSALYLKGFIYVFGGFDINSQVTSLCEKYDMNRGGWNKISAMNYSRAYATPMIYEQQYILLFGGFGGQKIDGV